LEKGDFVLEGAILETWPIVKANKEDAMLE
jgi:hypothetical protein